MLVHKQQAKWYGVGGFNDHDKEDNGGLSFAQW